MKCYDDLWLKSVWFVNSLTAGRGWVNHEVYTSHTAAVEHSQWAWIHTGLWQNIFLASVSEVELSRSQSCWGVVNELNSRNNIGRHFKKAGRQPCFLLFYIVFFIFYFSLSPGCDGTYNSQSTLIFLNFVENCTAKRCPFLFSVWKDIALAENLYAFLIIIIIIIFFFLEIKQVQSSLLWISDLKNNRKFLFF